MGQLQGLHRAACDTAPRCPPHGPHCWPQRPLSSSVTHHGVARRHHTPSIEPAEEGTRWVESKRGGAGSIPPCNPTSPYPALQRVEVSVAETCLALPLRSGADFILTSCRPTHPPDTVPSRPQQTQLGISPSLSLLPCRVPTRRGSLRRKTASEDAIAVIQQTTPTKAPPS